MWWKYDVAVGQVGAIELPDEAVIIEARRSGGKLAVAYLAPVEFSKSDAAALRKVNEDILPGRTVAPKPDVPKVDDIGPAEPLDN